MSDRHNLPPSAPKRRRITRRRFLGTLACTAVGVTTATPFYAVAVEPHSVVVVDQPLPLANVPTAWRGRTIVQISDLHVGPIVDSDYLRAALKQVNQLKPDLLVTTGDFMSCRLAEQIDATVDILSVLDAPPLGHYACLGNHDYGDRWRSNRTATMLVRRMSDLGIRTLRNEAVEVEGLPIAGIDELYSGRADIARTIAELRLTNDRTDGVVLAHNPDLADQPGWDGFHGWILSGHTHGGQVRLPLLGCPILPVNNKRYTTGHVDLSTTRQMYINPGLGYLRRIRLLCPPEITRFTVG